jgi:hypothetical protein
MRTHQSARSVLISPHLFLIKGTRHTTALGRTHQSAHSVLLSKYLSLVFFSTKVRGTRPPWDVFRPRDADEREGHCSQTRWHCEEEPIGRVGRCHVDTGVCVLCDIACPTSHLAVLSPRLFRCLTFLAFLSNKFVCERYIQRWFLSTRIPQYGFQGLTLQ